ncbi:hypothetical protein [Paraburkholderia hospita]|uniref:hypothetical protein n=1 Tax=Paraburkholderia hospita TaxID=169430 RepID=UPI001055A935|nr:hypothetical protein [Paraburkholderia hospita]
MLTLVVESASARVSAMPSADHVAVQIAAERQELLDAPVFQVGSSAKSDALPSRTGLTDLLAVGIDAVRHLILDYEPDVAKPMPDMVVATIMRASPVMRDSSRWSVPKARRTSVAISSLMPRLLWRRIPSTSDRSTAWAVFVSRPCRHVLESHIRSSTIARRPCRQRTCSITASSRSSTGPLLRVLTERGTEYFGNPERHESELYRSRR